MRAVGLAFLLLGTLAFLYPFYRLYVPWIRADVGDLRVAAGLLVAVGAITLAVYRNRS